MPLPRERQHQLPVPRLDLQRRQRPGGGEAGRGTRCADPAARPGEVLPGARVRRRDLALHRRHGRGAARGRPARIPVQPGRLARDLELAHVPVRLAPAVRQPGARPARAVPASNLSRAGLPADLQARDAQRRRAARERQRPGTPHLRRRARGRLPRARAFPAAAGVVPPDEADGAGRRDRPGQLARGKEVRHQVPPPVAAAILQSHRPAVGRFLHAALDRAGRRQAQRAVELQPVPPPRALRRDARLDGKWIVEQITPGDECLSRTDVGVAAWRRFVQSHARKPPRSAEEAAAPERFALRRDLGRMEA